MSPLFLSLLFIAGGQARPVLAIAPPVTDQPNEGWLGMSLADDLETRLLEHSAFDPAAARTFAPVSIFGWRQTSSAARQLGMKPAVMFSAEQGTRLAKTLGATSVFTATYWVKSASVRILWRLVGSTATPARDMEVPLDSVPQAVERILAALLLELELAHLGVPYDPLPPMPLESVRPFGQALEILRDQSLDPRAQLVLTPERLADAHRLLVDATTSFPEFARAWAARAVASAMLGETARAEDELAQAKATSSPEAPFVAITQFYLTCRAGDLDPAIQRLGHALNSHLGFLLGLGYLGEAFLRARRNEEAFKLFTLYRDRVPNSPWVSAMRAEAGARMGHGEAAIRELKSLQARFPDSTIVLATLAAQQIEARRMKEAQRALEQGLAVAPKSALLLARLAHVKIELGNLEEAVSLAQSAVANLDTIRGEPAAGYAYVILGRSLALSGKTSEAWAPFNTAARLGVDERDIESLARDERLAAMIADPKFPPALRPPGPAGR